MYQPSEASKPFAWRQICLLPSVPSTGSHNEFCLFSMCSCVIIPQLACSCFVFGGLEFALKKNNKSVRDPWSIETVEGCLPDHLSLP